MTDAACCTLRDRDQRQLVFAFVHVKRTWIGRPRRGVDSQSSGGRTERRASIRRVARAELSTAADICGAIDEDSPESLEALLRLFAVATAYDDVIAAPLLGTVTNLAHSSRSPVVCIDLLRREPRLPSREPRYTH